MQRRYLVDYLRDLQRRELPDDRLQAVGDYVKALNDHTLATAEEHHPLADPAAYRRVLASYIKR